MTSTLGAWSNFYVMIGSSAAALTGLMFVVITLVFGEDRLEPNEEGIATFSTPTVMHFGTALFVAAALIAPWRSLVPPAVLLGVGGLYGVVHILRVAYRTRRLQEYRADLEDWIWYTILPLAGYGAILAGAIALPMTPVQALFAIGGCVALMILMGIRNAWDVVTFLAVRASRK